MMKLVTITHEDVCEYARQQPWRFLSACYELKPGTKAWMRRRRQALLRYLYLFLFIHKRNGHSHRHTTLPRAWRQELREVLTAKTCAVRPFSQETRFVPYTGRPVAPHIAPVDTTYRATLDPAVSGTYGRPAKEEGNGCACCGRHVAVGPPKIGLWVCQRCRQQVASAVRKVL
jgi:hypothetical protein